MYSMKKFAIAMLFVIALTYVIKTNGIEEAPIKRKNVKRREKKGSKTKIEEAWAAIRKAGRRD